MKFNIFKKKKENPKKIPERYKVPDHAVQKLLQLYDKFSESEKQLDKYYLWSYITTVIPQVTTDKNWRISFKNALIIEIVEDI